MKTKKQAGETPDISVSPQVKDILPEPLINYLYGLLKTDTGIMGNRHVFRLTINKLNGIEIQNIVHAGANRAYVIHKVFGFKPVNAEITAIISPDHRKIEITGVKSVSNITCGTEMQLTFAPAMA